MADKQMFDVEFLSITEKKRKKMKEYLLSQQVNITCDSDKMAPVLLTKI